MFLFNLLPSFLQHDIYFFAGELQFAVIGTSLLSLSWGFVWATETFYRHDEKDIEEEESPGIFRRFLNIIWNALAISSRVIALALFASIHKYIAAALIIAQIVMYILAVWCWCNLLECFGKIEYSPLAISSIFNILLVHGRSKYKIYAIYWALTMVESAALITIWYLETKDEDYWYRLPVSAYVIFSYILSFLLKTCIMNCPKLCSCCKEEKPKGQDNYDYM